MELRGNLGRLAGAGAAVAFGSTLLVGTATAAQAAAPVPVYYQVINGNSSNACLQVTGIVNNKGNVVLGNCDRSAKQVWTIIDGVFRNPASDQCLDSDGGDVYTMKCNGGEWQSWRTTSGSPKSINHALKGKYLHADGNVGNQVVLKPTIGTASRWVIDRVG